MKSRFFLVFLLLLVGLLVLNQTVYAAISLYLNDGKVDMPSAPRIIAGRVTVPVDLVCQKLGFKFGWSSEEAYWIGIGTDVYYGRVGSESLQGSGQVIKLGAPAEISEGHLFISLSALADLLGLKLSWDTQNRALRLQGTVHVTAGDPSTAGTVPSAGSSAGGSGDAGRADSAPPTSSGKGADADPSLARIQSIALVRENTRQSLEIVADRGIGLSINLLKEPPRLVIDIPQAILSSAEKTNFTPQGLVQNLRLSQFQADVVRAVVDLERMTGYQVEELAEGRFAIHLNEVVSGMRVVRDGRVVSVVIGTSGEVQPETLLLREPNRLVVDLIGTTLAMPTATSRLSDPLLSEVRVSQFQPHIVRAVFELKQLLTLEQVTVVASKNGAKIILVSDDVPGEEYSIPSLVWACGEPENTEKLLTDQAAVNSVSAEKFADALSPERAAGMTVAEVGPQLRYVKDKVIVIDPGHGGIEVGAAGREGVWEKDLNLDVALAVAKGLKLAGAQVRLTRDSDVLTSLQARAECANTRQADAFISIHFNASYFKQAMGTETLFRNNHVLSQLLAASLQRTVSDVLETIDRGIKVREDLYILRHSTVPTALVEVGFLDHEEEGARFLNAAEREKAAVGILLGVERFFARLAAGDLGEQDQEDASTGVSKQLLQGKAVEKAKSEQVREDAAVEQEGP